MALITIDGDSYEFKGSGKLLQFLLDTGIELPHFCYHPAMSVPANCRQCLVEVGMPVIDRDTRQPKVDADGNTVVQWFPKLQTSCSVDVADGMVVRTHRQSEQVKRAQQDNLEFLLINHPLDCPICDQAGQCPLQIQAYKFGPEGSRFEFRKVHKPKRVVLGPRVMLDAERCINCTRCTRFTEEISKSNQLTITQRGVKNYPLTPPGVTFDDPYSMNVIDICPVGALTSIDFRFKARAWEVSQTPSITVRNAKGSNCYYWVRDNLIVNITPRQNLSVNDYWLPDEDRENVEWFNEQRANGAQVRVNGTLQETTWEAALAQASAMLSGAKGRVAFVGSAQAPVEDNFLLTQLAASIDGKVLGYVPHLVAGAGDNWLRTEDKSPNAQGCERLGMAPIDASLFEASLAETDVLVVLAEDLVTAGYASADALSNVRVIALPFHTTNQTLVQADVVLPLAMVVETVGTFVNCDGHAQRVVPAKAIRGVNRTLMMAMGQSRTDRHGTPFDRWHNESHKIDCRPGWDLLGEIARATGVSGDFSTPKKIMAHLSATHPAFAGATYDAMKLDGVRLADQSVSA